MDQKLVADILQAEIQVGRKIKQNQDNLKQFSEFNPEHAFETLKKFYINSYNLSESHLQQSLSQSKFANVPGAAYKGVVDLEKLTLLYRQYEETVSSFEIQAILSRHSAASDKGMDYDCFLKFIGFNLGETKRKNQIFDSQARTERSLTERCMKALSSLFLLELDLLRFTEVHKVSLINNYGFDSATFFSQIDYRNQSQIDFELLQQFFRRNGQEISLQDYQILLTRLKRNKQLENQYITRQEFIQLISPQLPYRGKSYMGQSVMYQSQVGAGASQKLSVHPNEKTVRFQDQTTSFHNGNSVNIQQSVQQKSVIHQQSEDLRATQLVQDQSKILFGQDQSKILVGQDQFRQSYVPQVAEYPPLQQSFQTSQVPIHHSQGSIVQVPTLVQGQNIQTNVPPQGVFMTPPGQLPPPPPPGYVLVQHPPQNVVVQNIPQPIYGTNTSQPFLVQQPNYQKVQEPVNQYYQQDFNQPDQRIVNDKRPNAVLEAMNEILKKDNEKLQQENKDLMMRVVEFEQLQKREVEELQRRQEEEKKKENDLKQQREEEQKQRLIGQSQQYSSPIQFVSPHLNRVITHSISPQPILSQQIVQSQGIASPPMSPIRLVPQVQSQDTQRERLIAQQLIQSQQVIEAPSYILQPNQVPTYVVNNHPFQTSPPSIMNNITNNNNQFIPHLIPKYNPQNLEIREAMNQQFAPPQPFIQQGVNFQAKNQPIHDPYTSHYPNRLNY